MYKRRNFKDFEVIILKDFFITSTTVWNESEKIIEKLEKAQYIKSREDFG
ncbi:hypothetical protein CLHOM_19120 [Clostridium homopropionicum DSM 5847]|uniref:Uncharacterized protein n=1 Tax=Clostridium homopropionicum DSM 5847 TaxID=1121318 RepID=A0A0L6ZAL4_9CLOT|nr:hypothetical protein [Clostridium homopropionicum]KOA19823.1 hypothetical protein CLHOM_19120 [Clostridium homopropionicum DSM 5847]SFF76661.1 hypothetical protein SAMN04488501_10281 [Clostridium homopropionicum]